MVVEDRVDPGGVGRRGRGSARSKRPSGSSRPRRPKPRVRRSSRSRVRHLGRRLRRRRAGSAAVMLLPIVAPVGIALGDLVAERARAARRSSATAPLRRLVGDGRRRGGARRRRSTRRCAACRAASCADSTKGRSGGGGAPGSVEPPLTTSSQSAVSSTVRLTQPSTASPFQSSRSGASETRPRWGLRPKSPQEAAGMRIEPPPSPAEAIGTSPAATAAALPPLEPPGVRCGFQGLRVTP